MTQKRRFRNLERFGFGPNVMKKIKVCVRCGRIVKTKGYVCPECGERLPRETLFDCYKRRHKICPDCDTVLTDDSKFCSNCGKPVFNNLQNYQFNISKGGKRNET